MLNPMPQRGTRIWGNDVADPDGTMQNLLFVPEEVTFLYQDRGLIWFSRDLNPKPTDNGMGWYSSEFFYTEAESQENCDLLNQEAAGIITPRKQKQIDDARAAAERMRQGGIFRIFG